MTQPWTPQQGHGHQPYGPRLAQPHPPLPHPRREAQPPYGPPPQRAQPASHRRAEPRNGLGLAAAVVGPVGILFGLFPLTGFVAVICGLVAVLLALAGRSRHEKGLATNGRTALAGLVSGALALALGVWGTTIVVQATDELVATLEGPAPVATGPVAGGGPDAPAGVAAFGRRVTFDDGVAVEVTTPQAFTPGSHAVGNERDRAVSFEITIVNGSDEPLETVAATLRATHSGRDAPLVFDLQYGMKGPPQVTVLPGKSITFPVAVSIGKDVADLRIDVSPGFVGDPAVFSGQV
jgi:hypothetical protein